ncbi:hypothetical protein DCO58_10495 [Helicobacter saguini]|uniref:Poly E-rich protein n=1 Tax=Helicobacter saguini TaxID=1548018 RepID=A0A347VPP3_9HELI|nr:hypothetical protein [Helicobacter saguini]MWV61272.1 hypothetical protein [Helicobacter saguini]MWV68061.1 hypothetical protein [Helicobacter saguini]MWV70476.1 hypothetical protein [Helicobacter saguini]MWV72377.1 hypothetical protein [Helicobacter saguini]TLD92341.1 hypothetical protein LS64_010480 [Helicobacter saguini]
MQKLKVLLLNQNPVIKKLVTIASGKLNLDVENVARIPADFKPKDYACIIVDDENVGKNLEKLTTLQDKIKVCLLFGRKTQVKHHEFNIAIQKPFLPTDILEILNQCIPSEEELAKRAEKEGKNIESADKTKEIDMDLKSAEVNMPDILGKDAKPDIHINKEALESEAKETKDLDDFDFDPDSLDLGALEKASSGSVEDKSHEDSGNMVLTTKDTESKAAAKDSTKDSGGGLDDIGDFDNLDFSGIDGVSSEDSKDSSKETSKGAFDKDLSDLKGDSAKNTESKSDNPLDLSNFDLDSMIDASALKSASTGLKKEELEKEAKEAAQNHNDDDLFLDDEDDELAKLRPKPKDFLKAKEEEEKAKADSNAIDTETTKDSKADVGESKKDSTESKSPLDELDSLGDFDNLDLSGIDGISSETDSKDSKDVAKDSKEDSKEQKKTIAKDSTESKGDATTSKSPTKATDGIDLDSMDLSDLGLDSKNDLDNLDLSDLNADLSGDLSKDVATDFLETKTDSKENAEIAPDESSLNADIASDLDLANDLENLDSKISQDSKNIPQERITNESLDDAFADLSAALENAFGNLDENNETHNMDFHDFLAQSDSANSPATDSAISETTQDSIESKSGFLENIEIPSEDSTPQSRITNESLDDAFADLSAALENAFGNLDENNETHNMDFHDFIAQSDSANSPATDSAISETTQDSIESKENIESNAQDSTLSQIESNETDSSLDFLNDSTTNIESNLDFLNDSKADLSLENEPLANALDSDSTLESNMDLESLGLDSNDSTNDIKEDSTFNIENIESNATDSSLDFLNDSSLDLSLENEPLENALDSDSNDIESNMDLESLGLDSNVSQIKEDSTFNTSLDFLNDSNLESPQDSTNKDSKTKHLDDAFDDLTSALDNAFGDDSNLAFLDSTADSIQDSSSDFSSDSTTQNIESSDDLQSLGLDSTNEIKEDSTLSAFSDSTADFFKDTQEPQVIESKKDTSLDFASDSTQELLIDDDVTQKETPANILDKDELNSVSDLLKEVNEMPTEAQLPEPETTQDSKETQENIESKEPKDSIESSQNLESNNEDSKENIESKPPLSPELAALKDVKHIFPSNIEDIGDLNESQVATALGEGNDSFAKLEKALSENDEKALNDAKKEDSKEASHVEPQGETSTQDSKETQEITESKTPQDSKNEPLDDIHTELENMEDSLEQKENMESMADLGDDLNAIFDLESTPDSNEKMQDLESSLQDSTKDLNEPQSHIEPQSETTQDSKDSIDSNKTQEITESNKEDSIESTQNDKELNLENDLDFSLDSTEQNLESNSKDLKDSNDNLLDFLNDSTLALQDDKELNLENDLDFNLDSALESKEATTDSSFNFLNDSTFDLESSDFDLPQDAPQKNDLDFNFDDLDERAAKNLESSMKKSIANDSIFDIGNTQDSLDFNFDSPSPEPSNIEINQNKELENLKSMDAKSFINFIKDTPSDKLDKILNNADISLNIHFGKK